MSKLHQVRQPARQGVGGADYQTPNVPCPRRSGRRAIRGMVLFAALAGSLAALAASGVPASAANRVTAGQVSAVSSFYDPATRGMHEFSATPSGVYETYKSGGAWHTDKINNLTGVNALTSFYDPAQGGSLHVLSATPSGVVETYWFNTSPGKQGGLINNLTGVSALTSLYDRASGGSLHVFAAIPSGVDETYWFNTSPGKNTDLINNL